MATHDYVLDNQNGALFRADINSALQAIVTNNSSPTAPVTTYPFMIWADTTTGIIKQRNDANTAWINLYNYVSPGFIGANTTITSLTGLTGNVLIRGTGGIGYGTNGGGEIIGQTSQASPNVTLTKRSGVINTALLNIPANSSFSFIANSSLITDRTILVVQLFFTGVGTSTGQFEVMAQASVSGTIITIKNTTNEVAINNHSIKFFMLETSFS
jgi:hypothetical protein